MGTYRCQLAALQACNCLCPALVAGDLCLKPLLLVLDALQLLLQLLLCFVQVGAGSSKLLLQALLLSLKLSLKQQQQQSHTTQRRVTHELAGVT